MKRSFIVFLFILSSIVSLSAQSVVETRGCIVDKAGDPLIGAVIFF